MKEVGTFNEQQLRNGEDKLAVSKCKEQDPTLKYVKTEFVKKGGKIIAMKIFLLTSEEYFNTKEI